MPNQSSSPGSDPQPEARLFTPGEEHLLPLSTTVSVLRAAADQVNKSALGAISALPWRTAVDILAELDQAIETARKIRASLATHVYLKGPHGTREIDGLGVLDVHRSNDRKNWDERSGVHDYVARQILKNDGEYPDPTQVVDWVLEVAGINYLRVNALRAMKLDDEDYCTKEAGSVSVSIKRPG